MECHGEMILTIGQFNTPFFGIWSMGKAQWLQDGQYVYRRVTYQKNWKEVTDVMEHLTKGVKPLDLQISN